MAGVVRHAPNNANQHQNTKREGYTALFVSFPGTWYTSDRGLHVPGRVRASQEMRKTTQKRRKITESWVCSYSDEHQTPSSAQALPSHRRDYDVITCRLRFTRLTSLVAHLPPTHVIQRRADPSCARLPSFVRPKRICSRQFGLLFITTSKLSLAGVPISGGETKSTLSFALSFLFRNHWS